MEQIVALNLSVGIFFKFGRDIVFRLHIDLRVDECKAVLECLFIGDKMFMLLTKIEAHLLSLYCFLCRFYFSARSKKLTITYFCQWFQW